MMKRILLLLVFATIPHLSIQARDKPAMITDPPNIPGMTVTGNIGKMCPREAPLRVDCNGDGTEDLLYPSYQVGWLREYMSPEELGTSGLLGAIEGAIVGAAARRPLINNKNFTYAGVVDGKNHQPIWSFQAKRMIDHFAVSRDQKRLFAASHDDHLYALELASGMMSWERNLGATILGFSVSEHEVIAVAAKNGVSAYKTDDGSIVWQHPIKAKIMTSGFGVMLDDADTAYVSSIDNNVYAFDRHSGKQRWVFESNGYPSLKVLIKGVLVVADKKEVIGLDGGSGSVRWRFDAKGKVHVQPMVQVDDTLVFFNGRRGSTAKLLALDAKQGDLRWSVNLQQVPVAKKRRVHVPEDTPLLRTSLVVQRDTNGMAEIVYVADLRSVQAIRLADGKVIWSAPSVNTQVIALVEDRILAADGKKVIRCFRSVDGNQLWEQKARSHVFQMERLGNSLLTTLYGRELLVLSMADGKVQAHLKLGQPYRLVRDGKDQLILCSERGSWILAPVSAVSTEMNDSL